MLESLESFKVDCYENGELIVVKWIGVEIKCIEVLNGSVSVCNSGI